MDHLTVGVFHDEALARELGKKGTASDVLMFNRKTDERIFTFIAPAMEKIAVKAQVASMVDCAVVSAAMISAEFGETVLLLDALGVTDGILVLPLYADREHVARMVQGTVLAKYHILENKPVDILQCLSSMVVQRDATSPVMVSVDHSFSVKGVGEVILGFVRQGVVRRHDTLRLLPADKDVLVRSIQMQDQDFAEAAAGSRVGLLIKDATVEDMKRGSLLCAPGAAMLSKEIVLGFSKNPFYPEFRAGLFHVAVGMQVVPAMVSLGEAGLVKVSLEKPVGFTSNETFVLLDLNAKKMHLMGKGAAVSY
jgi:selenocysteine-specific translation elongation factor